MQDSVSAAHRDGQGNVRVAFATLAMGDSSAVNLPKDRTPRSLLTMGLVIDDISSFWSGLTQSHRICVRLPFAE